MCEWRNVWLVEVWVEVGGVVLVGEPVENDWVKVMRGDDDGGFGRVRVGVSEVRNMGY